MQNNYGQIKPDALRTAIARGSTDLARAEDHERKFAAAGEHQKAFCARVDVRFCRRALSEMRAALGQTSATSGTSSPQPTPTLRTPAAPTATSGGGNGGGDDPRKTKSFAPPLADAAAPAQAHDAVRRSWDQSVARVNARNGFGAERAAPPSPAPRTAIEASWNEVVARVNSRNGFSEEPAEQEASKNGWDGIVAEVNERLALPN